MGGEAGEGVTIVEIVVPGVPDSRCRPNNHQVSERTRIRHRRAFADDAVMPLRAARIAQDARFPVAGAVIVDLTFRWPSGRKEQDRDSLITTSKFLIDKLEREGIIVNDRDVRYGEIEQEFGVHRPETVLRLRRAA